MPIGKFEIVEARGSQVRIVADKGAYAKIRHGESVRKLTTILKVYYCKIICTQKYSVPTRCAGDAANKHWNWN